MLPEATPRRIPGRIENFVCDVGLFLLIVVIAPLGATYEAVRDGFVEDIRSIRQYAQAHGF